ncbi:MAG: class I SAM-dependent methyltransferase [Chloroflexota bacterium]|nr:MAG: class I SAM-dependent methyltransferase [Chloroflexota bacterium]
MSNTENEWAIKLFNKSVLKQRKFKQITAFLGPTKKLHCLDVGGDNGVISYMLRRYGGEWTSADLDATNVAAIKNLVQTNVHQIDGSSTPFRSNEFDRIVIVDFLEHIPNDEQFIAELYRILRPGGVLVVNVPHIKNGFLRRMRYALGQTDEKHGHLRPGYTLQGLETLLDDKFLLVKSNTYSKFFSELIDVAVVGLVSRIKKEDGEDSKKGMIITDQDIERSSFMFGFYSVVYPFIRLFSMLDALLFFRSGYMLIASAQVNKFQYSP